MARKSPSESVFVLTLPLKCESWQKDRLDTMFRVGNEIKNHLIAYEKAQYRCLMERKDWKNVQTSLAEAYKAEDAVAKKLLLEKRNTLIAAAGFSLYQFEKQANKYRKHYISVGGKGCWVNGHISQKIAASVWKAFESLLYCKGDEVRFSKRTDFTALVAKSNGTGIVYRNDTVFINKMALPVMRDAKDTYGYQREALSRDIRYCGISRRWYASGWKYFVQLTLDGKPPVKVRPDTGELLHPLGTGRVGHDIGTQTIASVGKGNVLLTELADKVKGIDAELRRINRAMDRSRRSCNPVMFREDGTIVPKSQLPPECLDNRGRRRWVRSKHYLRLEGLRRELYRRQRELRTQQHNELANELMGYGNQHFIEEMRFRGLAKRAKETKKNDKGKFMRKKRFGKSISNKAPAAFVNILERKVVDAGGTFQKVNTFTVKASQLNHITETYTKKNLNKRWNTMPDGTKVQRDLYSAFLIMNVDESLGKVDIPLCNEAYEQFLKLHNEEVKRIEATIGVTPSSMGIKHTA